MRMCVCACVCVGVCVCKGVSVVYVSTIDIKRFGIMLREEILICTTILKNISYTKQNILSTGSTKKLNALPSECFLL